MPYSTNIGFVLRELDAIGVFSYVIPFLLFFSITYAILSHTKIFKENKAIPLIIGVSVGVLVLYDQRVPLFLSQIFPQLGIGLTLLLTAILLFGIFVPMEGFDKANWGNYVFMGLGMLFFVVILFSSMAEYSFWTSWWWQEYWPALVVLVIVAAVVVLISSFGKND